MMKPTILVTVPASRMPEYKKGEDLPREINREFNILYFFSSDVKKEEIRIISDTKLYIEKLDIL